MELEGVVDAKPCSRGGSRVLSFFEGVFTVCCLRV
jgi:hypothetical protein